MKTILLFLSCFILNAELVCVYKIGALSRWVEKPRTVQQYNKYLKIHLSSEYHFTIQVRDVIKTKNSIVEYINTNGEYKKIKYYACTQWSN